MTRVERRQTERKTLENHTYINIEPNNVGMVLNVSAGGLCFHSIDPIKHNGTVRFGLSSQKQRIEAEGVLVWSDDTQRAGLRFTSLSAVARDRVRSWLSESAAFPQPMAPVAHDTRVAKPVAFPSTPLAMGSPEPRLRIRLSGFSGGLATGLLVAFLVAGVFMFHGYRHEFGEWLIRTGERFAAKPQPFAVAAAAPNEAVSSPPPSTPTASRVVSEVRKVESALTKAVTPAPKTPSVPRNPDPVPQIRKAEPEPDPISTRSSANSESPRPAKPAPVEVASAGTDAPATSASPKHEPVPTPAKLEPASTSSPATPVVLAASGPKLDTTPTSAPASTPGIRTEESRSGSTPSTLEMFFEVGKFKNPLLAHDQADKVAQLGFPAKAVHKHFLWTNSYQVLVGPYSDEESAKTTHDTLVSNGYKPETFQKGSHSLILASALSTDGGPAPEGEYVVSWESYIDNASVKFLRNNSLVTTANAKWVKHPAKYRVDSYVYRKNPDGSRTLLEIHFGGMNQALVFGKTS